MRFLAHLSHYVCAEMRRGAAQLPRVDPYVTE